MAVSVCCTEVPEESAWAARKLLGSQLFIAFLLLVLVSGPNVMWQMTLAGKVQQNDLDENALNSILENSTLLQSFPVVKELNLTKMKEDWMEASSDLNKDHYTGMLVGSSVILVLMPFFCFCVARCAISGKHTSKMCCICCVEGLCGCSSFLFWFIPLALAAGVCWHLKNDPEFLSCAKMVPFVQNVISDRYERIIEAQQPPPMVNVATLTATAAPSLGMALKNVFQAANATTDFATPYLDAVSTLINNVTYVGTLESSWVVAFKASYPGALSTEPVSLMNTTNNFLEYMFFNTQAQQMEFCNEQVERIYKNVGFLSLLFTGLALAACCKVFACCLGATEAHYARISFAKAGSAIKINTDEEAQSLLSTHQTPPPPEGSKGEPAKKGFFEACCTNNCGRK